MNSNQLLNTNQSGFRPLHSTSTAMINITDDWLSSFDHGELVGVVMLDLKKAFDTVDLDILIQKLKHYGVDDKGINWFNSYLKGRSHFTTINGKNSSFRPVSCGIPQGSIIGPLIFIIYINDLPLHVSHCKVSMYADDTALYYPSKNESDLIDKINEDMTGVKEWLKRNKLSLNVEKTEFILLGTRSKLRNIHDDKITITINGTPLKHVHTCKHLGVIVDENLIWRNHIDHVRRKALAGVHVIKKVKNIFPQTTIKLLNNLAPMYLKNKFKYTNTGYDLRRSSLSLSTPMPKTDSLKRSFCYRGAMTWNSLNHDIETANSVNRFKCKLKARNV